MNSISFAGTGTLVLLIEMVLRAFGITPEPGSALAVINGLVILGGWVFLVWGQFRRKDLRYGLVRK